MLTYYDVDGTQDDVPSTITMMKKVYKITYEDAMSITMMPTDKYEEDDSRTTSEAPTATFAKTKTKTTK